MIHEIVRQFREKRILEGEDSPDYERCIQISTTSSLKAMTKPGLLVILSPLAMGFLFGARGVCGLLAGAIVSGV
jgi:K(+)-stimulated pyrophosphate-energized sodium pump